MAYARIVDKAGGAPVCTEPHAAEGLPAFRTACRRALPHRSCLLPREGSYGIMNASRSSEVNRDPCLAVGASRERTDPVPFRMEPVYPAASKRRDEHMEKELSS